MKEIVLIVGLLASSYFGGCAVERLAIQPTRVNVEKVLRGMGN